MRLLKQYRERLTGIGDVHYLEEVAFLIHTFESPVFETLLRMEGTAHVSTNKIQPARVKPETTHHCEVRNGKIPSNSSLQNGDVCHNIHNENINNSVPSGNIDISVSMGTSQMTAQPLPDRLVQLSHPVTNVVSTGVTGKEVSTHPVTAPGYSFYLTSSNSQLSNTDSWGSIELPMGDDGNGVNSLKKIPSPTTLSPLSQIPSSNKSSSSSVSMKSTVTVGDSSKGPTSDTALVGSSGSHGASSTSKVTAKKKEERVTVSLHKGKEGLGFSVVGLATEHKGDLGIYIQEIQKGGVAEK